MGKVDTMKPYEGEERRLPHWWDKWVNPTTVLALIGGIVWGIQLNMAVVDHTGKIGAINGRLDAHQLLLQEQATTMAKTAVILQNIQDKLVNVAEDVSEHKADSGEWKQRIKVNETKIETLSHRHDFQNNTEGYR